MRRNSLAVIAILCLVITGQYEVCAQNLNPQDSTNTSPDDNDSTITEPPGDSDSSIFLYYPFEDYSNMGGTGTDNPMYLNNPSNIESNIEYDPESDQYNMSQTIGDNHYRNPSYMTFEEYKAYDMDKALKEYWYQKAKSESFDSERSSAPVKGFKKWVPGGLTGIVDIRPKGSAELKFAIKTNKTDNPSLPKKTRKTTTFDSETLLNRLRELAFLNKGLRIVYEDERTDDEEVVLKYKGGIVEYVQYLNRNRDALHRKPIYFEQKKDDVECDISLQYTTTHP